LAAGWQRVWLTIGHCLAAGWQRVWLAAEWQRVWLRIGHRLSTFLCLFQARIPWASIVIISQCKPW
jgi:hypothetical protein